MECAMRELTSHKVSGLNEALRIDAIDELGSGHACHAYRVTPTRGNALGVLIEFQNGPLNETAYPNGLSNEALLAIVEDRLASFQRGEYACPENAISLTKVQEAMMWLQKRTRDRIARGVEGEKAIVRYLAIDPGQANGDMSACCAVEMEARRKQS